MNMNWFPKRIRTLTLFFIAALLIPIFFRSSYVLHIMVLLGIWIILTDSLNFLTGFAGQLSLGHAAFVAIGAYAGAMLIRNGHWPFWSALFVGGIVSLVAGLILGLMALRLRGDYLGMVTLGFGEIIRIFCINLINITNGPAGFANIHRPSLFGYTFSGELPYYFLILALVFVIHYAVERMLFSRFGRACLAVRDDEVAANAMGVRDYNYKVWAFCISCGICGIVGVFYAAWTTVVNPNSFTLNDSIMLNVMNTLGGSGSLYGPLPGGIVIGGLPELLRPYTTGARIASLRFSFMGLLLIVLMLVRPQGFYGMSISRGYISLSPIRKFFVRGSVEDAKREEITKINSAVDDQILLEVVNG
jgi:branched-chain amino acid transport system permease protein